MSTTVRSSPELRAAGPTRQPLTARAARVRNAFIQHAASRLGVAVPDDATLAALPADASLPDVIGRWRKSQERDDAVVARHPGLLLRAGVATAVTLLALAFSYGRLQ